MPISLLSHTVSVMPNDMATPGAKPSLLMISLSKQPSTVRQAICGLSSWQPIHCSLPFITSNNTYGVLLPTMTVHHSQQPIQSVLCLLPHQSHWSSHQVNKDYNSLQIHSHQLYGHRGSLGNSTICMLNCFEEPLICICIYKIKHATNSLRSTE